MMVFVDLIDRFTISLLPLRIIVALAGAIRVDQDDLEEELRATFRVFDKDGNGTINANELKRFVRLWDTELTEDEADDMIGQADPNKTGSITYDAFVQFLLHS